MLYICVENLPPTQAPPSSQVQISHYQCYHYPWESSCFGLWGFFANMNRREQNIKHFHFFPSHFPHFWYIFLLEIILLFIKHKSDYATVVLNHLRVPLLFKRVSLQELQAHVWIYKASPLSIPLLPLTLSTTVRLKHMQWFSHTRPHHPLMPGHVLLLWRGVPSFLSTFQITSALKPRSGNNSHRAACQVWCSFLC